MSKSLMDKIEQGRQYRSMTFECRKQEEDSENKNYIVEGYATTFNEPYTLYEDDELRYNEQVADNAFDECNMDDVIFQYDHEGRVYARISNKTLSVEKDEHGLKIRADLGGTEDGRKLYEEIKGGYTTKMSFGFTVTGDNEEVKNIQGEKTEVLRTITKIGRLYDVSAVSLPANDGTEISARSLINGAKEKRHKEAERILAEEKRKMTVEAEERQRLLTLLSLEN